MLTELGKALPYIVKLNVFDGETAYDGHLFNVLKNNIGSFIFQTAQALGLELNLNDDEIPIVLSYLAELPAPKCKELVGNRQQHEHEISYAFRLKCFHILASFSAVILAIGVLATLLTSPPIVLTLLNTIGTLGLGVSTYGLFAMEKKSHKETTEEPNLENKVIPF